MKLILITLNSATAPLYIASLNATPILEAPCYLTALGVIKALSTALSVSYSEVSLDAPHGSYSAREACQDVHAKFQPTASVRRVSHWNKDVDQTADFLMSVTDQRHEDGQLFVDVGPESGDLDADALGLVVEVSHLDAYPGERLASATVFLDHSNPGFTIFKANNKLILIPDDNDLVSHQQVRFRGTSVPAIVFE